MSKLLALNFDVAASPAITLKAGDEASEMGHSFGWGFAWYPPDERSAVVVKDPQATGENAMVRLLRDWSRFRSATFLCFLRGAAQRMASEDTQPIVHPYAGRDWVLAHNGTLREGYDRALPLGDAPAFEPLGHTDTEHALCWLLAQLRARGVRRLAELPGAALQALFKQINDQGTANLLWSDGETMAVHQDATGFNRLRTARLTPPHAELTLLSDQLELELVSALDTGRTAIVVSSVALSDDDWIPMRGDQTLILRRGAIIWDSHADDASADPTVAADRRARRRPRRVYARTYDVLHRTRYAYAEPVEVSRHVFHLTPVHDRHQTLIKHSLDVTPDGPATRFEDVFGNEAERRSLDAPFDRMEIVARSRVRVPEFDRSRLHAPVRRAAIPVDWMPWQRHMMQPYLLPPELPELQLRELFDYAMSFVARQDYDLVGTLLEMNATIHREYAYKQGSTRLATTPFDVYSSRKGVCQDFANLLICLARLLALPARYRVGYIYTKADYENQLQSEASHAWAEIFLPWAGWFGLDPTNGCIASVDHIRVACGRNWVDAAPTSGTIFKGGGTESLDVSVQVEAIDEDAG